MTENDVLKSLKVCADMVTCEECYYSCKGGDCKECLMNAAYNVIMLQKDHLESASEDIRKLQLDKKTLEDMIAVKYTNEQLVKAVNEILEETTTEDISAVAQSALAFLRLIGADGHFALLPDGTAEIRLDK